MPPFKFISADERLSAPRGVKALIVGPTGIGKTSLLRTVDPASCLFIDIEAGDLAIADVAVDTIRMDDWPTARHIACAIGGPNPSYSPLSCYSEAHYREIGGALPNLEKYSTIFVDSLTAVSRLSYRWSEQQPEALSERTGKKDIRGAYGLHGREMISWLNQLQHVRGKNVIFVGILELVKDEYGRSDWAIQLEGSKTGRELPGIVNQVITMQSVDFGDGKQTRAFICTSPNRFGYPAKDRSGRLTQMEEPHLGKLISKLTTPASRPTAALVQTAKASEPNIFEAFNDLVDADNGVEHN
jgi:AAA domain